MVARLGPGSPAPGTPGEGEALLRMVPVVAFSPELEPLLPATLGPGPLTHQAPTDGADAAWLARVAEALRTLEARANAEADGGLCFLAVTLRHFLERIAPHEHPLLVALFARTDAGRGARPEHPNEVARVLDGW